MKKDSKLKVLRLERSLTVEALASAVPCDKSTISHWERGIKEPSPRYRAGYAKALHITVARLGQLVYVESVR